MTAGGSRHRPRPRSVPLAELCQKSGEIPGRVGNQTTECRVSGVAQSQLRGRMSKEEAYRQNAAKCLEMADKTSDVVIRLGLIDMAHVWFRLAEQAEKNSHLDLVYETPRSVRPPPP